MRELKFRFWNTLTGKFEEDSDLFFIRGDGVICSNDAAESHLEAEQYTGLKDKNGKEIYEGDIVKSTEHIGEVYQQGNGRWVIFCGKDKPHDGDLIVVSELEGEIYDLALTLGREYCEVIGNIHDNHELIEKEEE